MYGAEPVSRQTPIRPITWACLNRLIFILSCTNMSTCTWSKSPKKEGWNLHNSVNNGAEDSEVSSFLELSKGGFGVQERHPS